MIKTRSLYCGYGKRDVLMGIDLHIKEGDMTAILGPNGSGKSTLLLTMAGIVPVRSGSVQLKGNEIDRTGSRWRARQMASVPQKFQITFPFRCLSVVLMGRYSYLSRWGGYSQRDMETAFIAMENTGTISLARRLISEVSGGEAQRIIIARALAQEPSILLLDEATSNLDVARKLQIFNLLQRKNRDQGLTILCAMHDLNLASLYCKRLIFLKEGKLVMDGPTEETFNEKDLSEIYETDIRVSRHPVTGCPQAHFVPELSGEYHNAPNGAIAMESQSGLGDSDCR